MKNKNTDAKKAILDYMTWGSPMNQAFLIEALSKDGTEFNYTKNETNITKVKQYMKLFGADKAVKMLECYASLVITNQEALRENMANSFISPDAWIQSAKDALKTLELVQA